MSRHFIAGLTHSIKHKPGEFFYISGLLGNMLKTQIYSQRYTLELTIILHSLKHFHNFTFVACTFLIFSYIFIFLILSPYILLHEVLFFFYSVYISIY